jgi:signal transduction histidine kinase
MGAPGSVTDVPLSSLARGAAHDLRNVLFVISAHCEHLLASTGAADRSDLETFKDAADRGVALAAQIVDSGRDDLHVHTADVNTVIAGVEPLLRRMIGSEVAVRLELTPGVGEVTANPVQIEQLVMNLAVNARDAMPDGGTLTVTTETRTVSGAGTEQPSRFVVISVADTGRGIEPDIQARIFEPYFTTKGDHGTGVGLATVRAIAVLNGGHVEVSTHPGAGTTMRIVLPQARPCNSTFPTG